MRPNKTYAQDRSQRDDIKNLTMNISKSEQRVLHILAQGGLIRYKRGDNGRVQKVTCYTRDGMVLTNCTLDIFRKLKAKRLIQSKQSAPYRITRMGLLSVRAQLDNRA